VTSENRRGRDPSYTGGYNPNALSNPASEPSQRDKKKPSGPFSSIISSLTETKVPVHAGSGSAVTSATTPVSDPLAPPPRETWASPDRNASATARQQSGKLTGALNVRLFNITELIGAFAGGARTLGGQESVTLESLMAKHKSLDLTTELITRPGDPVNGGLANVYEGSWRNEKVLF